MTNTTEEIIARVGNIAGEMEGELSTLGKLEFAKPKKALIDADLAELRARFAELEQTYAALSKLIGNLEDEARETEKRPVAAALHGVDLDRCDSSGYFGPRTGNCTPDDPCRIHLIVQRLHPFGVPLPGFWSQADTGTADDQIEPAVVEAFRAYVEGTGITTTQFIGHALSAASGETEQGQACECAARKALAEVYEALAQAHIVLDHLPNEGSVAGVAWRAIEKLRSVRSAPCPCEGLPEIPCCPPHEAMWKAGTTKPLDNCFVCIRNERDSLRAELAKEEAAHANTIGQRDAAEEAADKLAYTIAPAEEIGEHSSTNDPWENAVEKLEEMQAEFQTIHQREASELAASRERERVLLAEVRAAQSNNRARNLELDALHYVWCDGGCEGGVHRFESHPPLTAEIVEAAARNTERLKRWHANNESRKAAALATPEGTVKP